MIVDNTCEHVSGPLCASREEALAQPGLIYIHLKKGGVYRKIVEAKYAGEQVAKGIPMAGERHAVYEHLWPFDHDFYSRPMSEFLEVVKTDKGTHRRFEFQPNTPLNDMKDD